MCKNLLVSLAFVAVLGIQFMHTEAQYSVGGVSPVLTQQLHTAVLSGAVEQAQNIIRVSKANPNASDPDKFTALHLVAMGIGPRSREMCIMLRANSANMNARDSQGNTPLLLAIAEGNAPVYDYLLQPITLADQRSVLVCNTNAKNIYNHTALHIATQRGDSDLVQRLVRSGANVNVIDKNGLTPLHYACRDGFGLIVNYLVQNGGRIKGATKDGWTCLHYAAHSGQQSIVEYAIFQRARVNALTSDLLTPLRIASLNHRTDIVTFIQSRGGRL